jgi:hypothetical protein
MPADAIKVTTLIFDLVTLSRRGLTLGLTLGLLNKIACNAIGQIGESINCVTMFRGLIDGVLFSKIR